MVGARNEDFREGDRSEYLAQYLLSAIGIAAPVIRQEDTGIDFVCATGHTISPGVQSYGSAFAVQVKSSSKPNVTLGGIRKKKPSSQKWRRYELEWMQDQRLPLLLGIVDKTALRIALYSTSAVGLSYVASRGKRPFELRLIPRSPNAAGDVGMPKESLPKTGVGHGNGKKYSVDLGPPLVSFDAAAIGDDGLRAAIIADLDHALSFEHLSASFKALGLGFFFWHLGGRDQSGRPRYAYMAQPSHAPQSPVLGMSLGAHAIELGTRLRSLDRSDLIQDLWNILDLAGASHAIPREVAESLFGRSP